MFKKPERDHRGGVSDDIETLIGPSVKIEGDFKSSGNVVVGGMVVGKLSTTAHLRIEEHAKIEASVEAKTAVIAGEVIGNITIEGNLEILSTARIKGDIKTRSIAIHQGAYLNGNFFMESKLANASSDAPSVKAVISDREQATKEWLGINEDAV